MVLTGGGLPVSNKYPIDESWVGPYDIFPSCKFCRHVGCVYADRSMAELAPCSICGWNPDVSRERIVEKYGLKAVYSLTEPRKKRVSRNV